MEAELLPFYKDMLVHERCTKLLIDRCIPPDVWYRYALGYIPKRGTKLRDRLLFPVRDPYGRFVAWQGRALLPEMTPKYWHNGGIWKSVNLYGLYECAESAFKKKYLIMNEGNIDVLTHAAANNPAIATMGVALSLHQCYLIRRYVQEVIYYIDDDPAGFNAGARAEQLLAAFDVKCHLRLVPDKDCKDSNDILKKHGINAVIKMGYP